MRFNRILIGTNLHSPFLFFNGEYRSPKEGKVLLPIFSLQDLHFRDYAEMQRGNTESSVEQAVEFFFPNTRCLGTNRVAVDVDGELFTQIHFKDLFFPVQLGLRGNPREWRVVVHLFLNRSTNNCRQNQQSVQHPTLPFFPNGKIIMS